MPFYFKKKKYKKHKTKPDFKYFADSCECTREQV